MGRPAEKQKDRIYGRKAGKQGKRQVGRQKRNQGRQKRNEEGRETAMKAEGQRGTWKCRQKGWNRKGQAERKAEIEKGRLKERP